jgi:hypothetical protein
MLELRLNAPVCQYMWKKLYLWREDGGLTFTPEVPDNETKVGFDSRIDVMF